MYEISSAAARSQYGSGCYRDTSMRMNKRKIDPRLVAKQRSKLTYGTQDNSSGCSHHSGASSSLNMYSGSESRGSYSTGSEPTSRTMTGSGIGKRSEKDDGVMVELDVVATAELWNEWRVFFNKYAPFFAAHSYADWLKAQPGDSETGYDDNYEGKKRRRFERNDCNRNRNNGIGLGGRLRGGIEKASIRRGYLFGTSSRDGKKGEEEDERRNYNGSNTNGYCGMTDSWTSGIGGGGFGSGRYGRERGRSTSGSTSSRDMDREREREREKYRREFCRNNNNKKKKNFREVANELCKESRKTKLEHCIKEEKMMSGER